MPLLPVCDQCEKPITEGDRAELTLALYHDNGAVSAHPGEAAMLHDACIEDYVAARREAVVPAPADE